MNKPKRSDYPDGRSGAKSYQEALDKWRTSNKKVKPVNNDPRPTWKKGESREEYRKRLLPWRERQKARKNKEKAEDLKKRGMKNTKRGTRPDRTPKSNNDLKVKKESYAKDRVGKVNLNSQEYKEAKAVNESIKLYTKPKNYKPRADAKVIKDKQKKGRTTSYKPRADAQVIKDKQTLKVKKDPLADYRRGPGTKLGKDTRITKKLKKAGFTEDRLAKLRKDHAEFKANRKKKKKKKS
jgi:hypothetical protein